MLNESDKLPAYFKTGKMKVLTYTILLISGLYVIATTGWIVTENRTILTVMELLTIWAAIVILLFMAELYSGCTQERKRQGLIALILTTCMAVVTISNHFIYMTVLNQLYRGAAMPDWLLLDGWPSLSKGLECVSWAFFLGLAMLYAAKVLEELKSQAIAWTMRVFAILTLAGLAGPLLGNMNLYILSTIGYSLGFLVISIEMILYFKKN